MHYPTHDAIRELINAAGSTCISIYLPTNPTEPNDRENPTRLKNLLQDAVGQLTEDEQRPLAAGLAAADELINDADFWRHQSKGLALFISERGLEYFNLPIPAPEELHVDDKLFITPLIDCASQYKTLYVLALSRGSAHLYKSSIEGLEEVPVKAMPVNQAESNKYVESEKLLQNRSSAGPAGSFHGEGADTHEPHARTHHYLQEVDDALARHFRKHAEPVVVAANEQTLGLFCKLTHYRNLVARLEVDPDSLSADKLHEKAWSVGASAFLDPVAEARNAYGSYSANDPNRVESAPDRVLEAAQSGRVGTLLVARPVAVTESGAFHERIPVDTETSAFIPTDPVESAVQATYRASGQVVLVPADILPPGVEVAAVMRY
jgi:hypothetical protein